MENNKRIINLIVVSTKCLKCGAERKVYFSSGFAYGERIVTTKTGKKCAYANLLEEHIIKELEKYCEEIYLEAGTSVLPGVLKKIVSSIYGITCDEIDGEKIDTISITKCPNCLGKIVEDDRVGEQIKEVEVFEVTHRTWQRLRDEERKEMIKKELIRQKYLK